MSKLTRLLTVKGTSPSLNETSLRTSSSLVSNKSALIERMQYHEDSEAQLGQRETWVKPLIKQMGEKEKSPARTLGIGIASQENELRYYNTLVDMWE